MRKDLSVILRNVTPVEPDRGLYGAILVRIERAERRAARLRFAVLGSTTLASIAALFPAISFARLEFVHTGFGEYVSVLFSDGGTVLAYWHEFALLLAESFPVLATTLLLFVAFVFLGSLRLTLLNARIAFHPNYSHN